MGLDGDIVAAEKCDVALVMLIEEAVSGQPLTIDTANSRCPSLDNLISGEASLVFEEAFG